MPYVPMTYDSSTSFDASNWKEALELTAPGGEDVFGLDSASLTKRVLIESQRQLAAYRFVMGDQWVDFGTPYALHRALPLPHPRWGFNVRATGCTFQEFNPQANPGNPGNAPWWTGANPALPVNRLTRYTHCWMTVHFDLAPYEFFEDADVSAEWQRYTVRYEVEHALQVMNRPEGGLVYAEGPTNDPKGQRVASAEGQPLYMPHDVARLGWYRVPAEYVADANFFLTRIRNCVGKCNSDWFPKVSGGANAGFAPHTLLMDSPKVDRRVSPLPSADGSLHVYFDIVLNMKVFDPPASVGSPIARGHQLVPWKSGGSGGGPGWYTATWGGGTGDPLVVKETDFNDVFKSVLAP